MHNYRKLETNIVFMLKLKSSILFIPKQIKKYIESQELRLNWFKKVLAGIMLARPDISALPLGIDACFARYYHSWKEGTDKDINVII